MFILTKTKVSILYDLITTDIYLLFNFCVLYIKARIYQYLYNTKVKEFVKDFSVNINLKYKRGNIS